MKIISIIKKVLNNNNSTIKTIKYISLFFFIFELKFENRKKDNKIKVCLCILGKNEKRYAREFVEYYKKLDVDKIFIYDNNDILGEKFEYMLGDYFIIQNNKHNYLNLLKIY